MKFYLVGGAVRDQLLGIQSHDRDWVVVGAEPKDLIELGFIQVGRNFPVFLHPKTKEEYALARTEKKSGHGYTGFICDFNSSITLEEDLVRRDFTINAIAMDKDKNIIDPYQGKKDLTNRKIKHVSNAFNEDPLRVLRAARFLAKLKHLNFKIDISTLELMKQMTISGELNHLTKERIWAETVKALLTKNPAIYFKTLEQCNALTVVYPQLLLLNKKPHISLDKLSTACNHTNNENIIITLFCINLLDDNLSNDKNLTQSKNFINQFFKDFKIKNKLKNFVLDSLYFFKNVKKNDTITNQKIIKLFDKINVWKDKNKLEEHLFVYFLYHKNSGNLKFENNNLVIKLKNDYKIASKIKALDVIALGAQGKDIPTALTSMRIEELDKIYS